MTEDEEFEFRYRYEQEQKGKTAAPSSIPGAEQYDAAQRKEQARLKNRTQDEITSEGYKKLGKKALGVGEGLLGVGSGITGYLGAFPATALTIAGKRTPVADWPTEFMSNVEKLSFQPKSEEGQKTLDFIGNELLAPFGLSPYANVGQVAARAGAVGRKGKAPIPQVSPRDFAADLRAAKVEPVVAPEPVAPQPTMPVTQDGQAMRPEDVMWRDRAQQMQIDALKPVDDAQVEMLQQGLGEQADAIRAQRQAAMEQEVARQRSLDFNAAERARQENAPTGFDAYQEQLRSSAEQRIPGDNTPLEFEQPYPVDANAYPDVMQDAPYQYEGGIDFDAAGPKSLPIEVADKLRTGDVTPDPFNRYSPNQAARRILEEGAKPAIRKGGKQSGAVDFQAIVDLFPSFARSRVQTPVYHGATKEIKGDFKTTKGFKDFRDDVGGIDQNGWIAPPRRAYAGDLGTWFSSTPEGTDTFAGTRTGVSGGNVNQAYINLTNPRVFATHGEFIDWLNNKASDGRSANSVRRSLIKEGYDGIKITESMTDGGGLRTDYVAFQPEQIKSAISPGFKHSQRGGIDFEALTNIFTGKKTVGGAMSGKLPITGPGTPIPDSVQHPVSRATIEAKRQLATAEKYTALGKSQYGDVKTIEELRSQLGGVKDINKNPVRDYVISGVEGMVRDFPSNPIFKYVRKQLTDARNNAAKFETEYVTGNNGINQLYRKMNKQEWADVSQALMAAGREQIALTPEQMSTWGFNENQQAFVTRLREALDAMHATASEALTANGMKGLGKREGYVPSMFSGAYTSLVGHMVKDGSKEKFVIRGIAQGDTKKQHAAAVEYYKTRGDKFTTVIQLPNKMLSGGVQKSNRVFDGFNDLVNAIAENDKDFAEIKALADSYAAEKIRKLNEFNVHEKKKSGVVGSLGDRPWLDRDANAKEFLEGLVNYLDEGARYYNYQNPLHNVTKIMNDPAIAADRPNTMKYLERHVAHVTGSSVGSHGKFLNQVWNTVMQSMGSSPQNVSTNIHRLHGAASAYMMGLWNPAFAITQMVQPAASGIPEALSIGKLTESGFRDAMVRNMVYSPMIDMALASNNTKMLESIPPHLVVAFRHAQDIGMTAFSESELTREVLQSKTEKNLNSVLHAPSQITERATRPYVFLTFVDMFHQQGFDKETSYRAAQYATDFAMTNYHPDERPMLYATFGHTGNFMGALTTYKHNLMTGMYTRGKDAVTGKELAPAAAAVAIGAALYGVSGVAGYQEMDEIVQAITDKNIKELVIGTGPKSTAKEGAWHGFASVLSGYDLQSRLSMASALPDTALDAASPQLGVFVDIGQKVYDAIKNGDEQSLIALKQASLPVGLKGLGEEKMLTDPEGFLQDASGKRKFDEPRTANERAVRKIIGLRPLRERLESDDLYSDTKSNKKKEERLADSSKRFKDAILRNDEAGIDHHYKRYIDNGGDPAVLFNDKAIAKWLEDSMKSQRERQQGTPAGNIGSMRKFEEYQQ